MNATLFPAPGARVVIRDAEWVVRHVDMISGEAYELVRDGVSELVREQEAVYLSSLEQIEALDPARTRLTPDRSPEFADSLLYTDLHCGSISRLLRFPACARYGSEAMPGPARKLKADTPPKRETRKFARVFMNGRSQAVRLPKEFRFDTDRVLVRREGRHVVLSPMFKDWDDYFENGARFTDDFFDAMDELRNTDLPLEEREPFD